MARVRLAIVVCVVALAVGCGTGGRGVVFDTARPVIALDVRDRSIAWLASRPVENRECDTRLWAWRRGGRPEPLPLPAENAGQCLAGDDLIAATVAVAPDAVGWTIDEEGGNDGEIFYGAGSAGRSASTFAHEFTNGGAGPNYSGELVAGVAAGRGGVVFGNAFVATRALVPSADECDLAPTEGGCASRVARGGVWLWRRGRFYRTPFEPVAALAAHDDLLALLTWPRTRRWVRNGEHYGPIEIATTAGRVVASIPSQKLAPLYGFDGMTMSGRLLAITHYPSVAVYALPDGAFVSDVPVPREVIGTYPHVAAGDHELVFWTPDSAVAVDVVSRRARVVADNGAVPGADSLRHITALAVDHDTVYWALTAGGRSVVHSLRLR